MKAARLHKINEPLIIEDISIPEIGMEDVLVKVRACGICGSDLHLLDGTTVLPRYPTTLGHEFSGVISKLGEAVQGWQEGDRVCVDFLVTCGKCSFCLAGRESICINRKGLGAYFDGGFAEYVKVPARNLIALPEEISFEEGAIITDAVATPFHAISKRANLKPGDTVAIFGAGGIAAHAIQLTKLSGAGLIIVVDIINEVLERAKRLGADMVINSTKENPVQKIKEITNGGVDLSLEAVGLQKTISQAVESLRPGGRALLIGLSTEDIVLPNPGIFVRSEFEVIGCYAFERAEIQTIIGMVSKGQLNLKESISRRISLDEINDGLEQLKTKEGNPLRIIVVQG